MSQIRKIELRKKIVEGWTDPSENTASRKTQGKALREQIGISKGGNRDEGFRNLRQPQGFQEHDFATGSGCLGRREGCRGRS
jgi:hypothetical protein